MLNAVPVMTVDEGEAFNALTDLVMSHELVFCDEVVGELEHVARNESPHVWAKAVRDSRADRGAAYALVEWVIANVPELVDPDAEFDLCAPYVLAQARQLDGTGPVYVVSEDVVDKATRVSLTTACLRVGAPTMTLRECFVAAGIVDLCN
jgi:hypothetical protein